MKIDNLFFRLLKGRFDLRLGKSHHKVVYELDIAFEEIIDCSITCFNRDAQHIAFG